MNVMKVIKNLNKAETDYCLAKRGLEVAKAEMTLHTDWEAELGKAKPTVAEKEAFITLKLVEEQNKVDCLKIRRDYLYRMYKISLMDL